MSLFDSFATPLTQEDGLDLFGAAGDDETLDTETEQDLADLEAEVDADIGGGGEGYGWGGYGADPAALIPAAPAGSPSVVDVGAATSAFIPKGSFFGIEWGTLIGTLGIDRLNPINDEAADLAYHLKSFVERQGWPADAAGREAVVRAAVAEAVIGFGEFVTDDNARAMWKALTEPGGTLYERAIAVIKQDLATAVGVLRDIFGEVLPSMVPYALGGGALGTKQFLNSLGLFYYLADKAGYSWYGEIVARLDSTGGVAAAPISIPRVPEGGYEREEIAPEAGFMPRPQTILAFGYALAVGIPALQGR